MWLYIRSVWYLLINPQNLIVLAYRTQLFRVDRNCFIVGKKEDARFIKYISQGLKFDLEKEKYKTIFGVRDNGCTIGLVNGWYDIGRGVILDQWKTDGLIGVYDRTNFEHLQRMLWDDYEANADYSNAD